MIPSADIRRNKLEGIRENDRKEADQKLFYKGKNEQFGVYRIDLDYLIYNRHNGRIEAEMLKWEKEHVVQVDAYDDELHDNVRYSKFLQVCLYLDFPYFRCDRV